MFKKPVLTQLKYRWRHREVKQFFQVKFCRLDNCAWRYQSLAVTDVYVCNKHRYLFNISQKIRNQSLVT